ncbi:hypothetical protein OHA45_01345 [Streptomyces lydicus]|nr:hypothetical protein [Streptomyces lydicus]
MRFKRDPAGGTDLRPTGIQNLRELDPLILVTLGVLPLVEEVPDVFNRTVQRRTPGLPNTRAALIDDLSNPDTLVFRKRTLPTIFQERFQIVGRSVEGLVRGLLQCPAAHVRFLGGSHPVVLERFAVGHGEEVQDVGVTARLRSFRSCLEPWPPCPPLLDDPRPLGGNHLGRRLTGIRSSVLRPRPRRHEQARQQRQ